MNLTKLNNICFTSLNLNIYIYMIYMEFEYFLINACSLNI